MRAKVVFTPCDGYTDPRDHNMIWSISSTEHGGAWQTKECFVDYYFYIFHILRVFAVRTPIRRFLSARCAFHAFLRFFPSRSEITPPK